MSVTESTDTDTEPSFILDAIAELDRIEVRERERRDRQEFQRDFVDIRTLGGKVLSYADAGEKPSWAGMGIEHRLLESMSPEALRAVLGEWPSVEIPEWGDA